MTRECCFACRSIPTEPAFQNNDNNNNNNSNKLWVCAYSNSKQDFVSLYNGETRWNDGNIIQYSTYKMNNMIDVW